MSSRGKRATGAQGRRVMGDPSLDKVLADIRTVAVWGKDKQDNEELLRILQEELGANPAAYDLTLLRLHLIEVAAMAVLQLQVVDQKLGT